MANGFTTNPRLLHSPAELGGLPGSISAAIGFFDGVHLGHQKVIQQSLTEARAQGGFGGVITFDRHPAKVVAPERAPRMIYTRERRLQEMAALGLDFILLLPFDHDLSRQTAGHFIGELKRQAPGLKRLVVGSNFVFGQGRTGNLSKLLELAGHWDFSVQGIDPVCLDGITISSTQIRKSINQADFGAASAMLGRTYAMEGRIVPGNQLGRKIGFPTANLDYGDLALPLEGVYSGWATTLQGQFRTVVNIGRRPTLPGQTPQVLVEAHLLGFSGDLYHQKLEIRFDKRLREERKFPSLEALKAQIQRDVDMARD